MIIGGIGKTALHHMLAPLATVAARFALGGFLAISNNLGVQRSRQGASLPGTGAVAAQRTLSADFGFFNQVYLNLLRGFGLMQNQVMTLRTAIAILNGFINKLTGFQLAAFL